MTQKRYAHDKRAEKKAQREILAELARLGGKLFDDDDVLYEGNKLVVPEGMTLERAVKFLTAKQEELETETNFQRVFNYRPWDGAWCMWNALKKVFGVVGHKDSTVQTLFGERTDPPQLITINVDVDKQDQVPWGNFTLPILPGVTFTTHGFRHPEYGSLFAIMAAGPKKYKAEIEGIFKIVEDELETNSLYRGKAFDGQDMPEFIDLTGIDPDKVVYSQEVLAQLEANIWAQLRYTPVFVAQGIPLKRAVLVFGPYGTGKTLAAILTGQEATANGWTFIKARPGRDNLMDVMQTARLYQPAVVFYEDVDQVADAEVAHEQSISQLLDNFDGIEAKDTRILCVLTTNHVDRIHKGMARPGRLDAMIEINELDLEGMAKLVRCTVGEKLGSSIDWERVFAASKEYKPAFVTEFAQRAIRYALVRTEGEAEGIQLLTEDLVNAAEDLQPQFQLMNDAKDRHTKPTLEVAVGDVVQKIVRANIDEDYLVPNGSS